MKNAKVIIFRLAITVLTLVASVGAASACTAGWYQPEVPESLRKY